MDFDEEEDEMNSCGKIMMAVVVLAFGLLGGCSGEKNCESRVSTYCTEGATYWMNSCGDFEELKEHCDCGCIDDHSACKLCDCESHTGTVCIKGVQYWTDSCDQPEEVIEACQCGCDTGGDACKEDCDCTPSCDGKQCGSDGCGENQNCGECEVGWTCNRAGACVKSETCNNGQLETYEECEGFDLRAETCVSLGYEAGDLTCADDCILDASQCRKCNNGLLEPGEMCDGDDFGEVTCQTLGFVGGTLHCNPNCMFIPVDDCNACGNGIIDEGETCDGSELGGETCESIGGGEGTLACRDDCRLDKSGCTCDDLGDCNTCIECAAGSSCSHLAIACMTTEGCIDYYGCFLTCEDNQCRDQCAVYHPDGKTEGYDLWSCLHCDNCYNDCSDVNAACP